LYKKLTLIHSGHEEGKSQKVITEGVGCSQSAVSKHIHMKMTERATCGRKRGTTTRDEDFEAKTVQE
jgi:predicted transcriptional regulator